MKRWTKNMKRTFSEDNLMCRMTPGVIYEVYAIAKWFGIETHEARGHLEALWHNGVLRRRKCQDKSWGFQRPEPFVAEPAEPLDMSIAAPPMPPDMTREMVDYEGPMRRHMELCKSTRR